MSDSVIARLAEQGLELPKVAVPAANYVSYVTTGNLVVISGQLPVLDGKMQYVGKLGAGISIEDGQAAARLCMLNVLAQLHDACAGKLERVKRCVRLGVFVNGTPEFIDHPKIANGASDLLVGVLGDKGKHARVAMGVGSLPFGVAVEVEALFEIEA
jgi:enamine deaminase RidA (YjgF/YER057c/UK114 family)